MANDIPLFKANLSVDTAGQGIISGSGQRAQAGVYGEAAQFLTQISDKATEIYGQEQVDLVKMGAVTQDELPSPVTVVGKKMRGAFAESQAVQTNIAISNTIRDITNNKSLSPNAMQEAIASSSEAMVKSHIPEMADTIRNNFARAGVSAVNNAANKRLAEQRELQNQSQKAQIEFWGDEYRRSLVSHERSLTASRELKEKMEFGPISEDKYIEEYNKIDTAAQQRLGDSKANLLKTINSRVAAGNMTEQMGAVYLKNLTRDARNEYLSFEASERGLKVLDNANLSFDEKLKIASKASSLAGMKNAEEDRFEREIDEYNTEVNNGELQRAKNLALEGDTEAARAIVSNLSKKNEVLGDGDLLKNLDSMTEDINFIAESGGPANPENFKVYKRAVKLGDFTSVEEVIQDLKFTGKTLNKTELFDLQGEVDKAPTSALSSPAFSASRSLIKLRLRDDPNEPSLMERSLGAKSSPVQKLIEQSRAEIEDGLISGVMDRTLLSPQAQRQFVQTEVSRAKRDLKVASGYLSVLSANGLKVDSSVDEVKRKIDSLYGKANPALAKQKFIEVTKAQMGIREFGDE